MKRQNRKPSLDEVAPLEVDEGRFALHTCEWFNRWLTTKFLLATILFLVVARFFAPFIFVALALGVITIVFLLALSRNWNPIHVKDKDTGLEYDTDSLAHAWRGILPAYKKIDEENKLRAVLLSREGRLPSGLPEEYEIRFGHRRMTAVHVCPFGLLDPTIGTEKTCDLFAHVPSFILAISADWQLPLFDCTKGNYVWVIGLLDRIPQLNVLGFLDCEISKPPSIVDAAN